MDVSVLTPTQLESKGVTPYVYDDNLEYVDLMSMSRISAFEARSRHRMGRELAALKSSSPFKGPVFYGWLWKKGASFKTWKKRFFLLHGCTLTYYTHPCVISTEKLGTRYLEIPAKGGLRVAAAVLTDETTFGIRITSSSGRILYVQAGDHGPRLEWLHVLQDAPQKKYGTSAVRCTSVSDIMTSRSFDMASRESSPSDSIFSTMSSDGEENLISDIQGWLYIRTSKLTGFRKRFVTLLDGHLYITSSPRPQCPQDVAHEVILVAPWNGHEYGIHIHLDRHKEMFAHATSSEEMNLWIEAMTNSR
ncbi:hypothetical protein Poli38472_004464 [Pythium oligandrum]|uniref:PH domain-containing protein n=1 Tax=Pythium oligandrum TaxID=41045 RepID=A0A8K1CAA1_PYTOL|nr:hypothetical protein Poli38472_004464 [Pythium oligandrum]|eukprot:TMW59395.1 hypothetical protein Poli38472_004464 [Pythium oligandrum]